MLLKHHQQQIRLVETQKRSFERKREGLFNKYLILEKSRWDGDLKKYDSFRDEYLVIINGILTDSIYKYREVSSEKCLIAEFGKPLAKRTERVLSDLDFTICYDDPKTEHMKLLRY